jgi:hypothetical protein
MHELDARLATAAQFHDGIRVSLSSFNPGQGAHAAPGPSFSQAPCSSLESPESALEYGDQPQLTGNTMLVKSLEKVVTDPTTQEWGGGEILSVYPTSTDARQVMAGVAGLAARCRNAAQVQQSIGMQISTREHLVTVPRVGDQAFDIEVRTTSPAGGDVASDWVIIRSGRCLLAVDEQAAPEAGRKYLQPVAQTAWRVFEGGS